MLLIGHAVMPHKMLFFTPKQTQCLKIVVVFLHFFGSFLFYPHETNTHTYTYKFCLSKLRAFSFNWRNACCNLRSCSITFLIVHTSPSVQRWFVSVVAKVIIFTTPKRFSHFQLCGVCDFCLSSWISILKGWSELLCC